MKTVQDNLIRLSKEIDKSKFKNVTTYYDMDNMQYVLDITGLKPYVISNTFSIPYTVIRNTNVDDLINYVNTKSFSEIVESEMQIMGIA